MVPPIRSGAELLEQSAWAAEIPGLVEQTRQWLVGLPIERRRLLREARGLAMPALHPAGIGRLFAMAGKVIGQASAWGTVDLGRAVWRAIVYGEDDDGERVKAAVARAERLVREAGPVYVKLGQFISTAQGLLPDEVVEAFAWCRDEVPPIPTPVARGIVERDLGRPIDAVFESFGDFPLASASIAQVHAARLRDGTEVVVKVRRPGLRRQFEADVRAMALLAAFGERRSSAVRAANARGFVELFAQLVLEEMDFRLEALNMIEIGLASEDAGILDALRVPRPIPDLVTRRVLVMEYLPGRRYTDAAGQLEPGVDPAQLIRVGIQGVLEHTLVYGIFHGDLHAGNVFLEPDGRYALLDFGIVGRLDADQRAALVRFMIGVGTFDARAQLEGLVQFGAIPPDTDLDQLVAELEALGPQPDVVTHDQMVDDMAQTMRLLVARGFRLPKELVLFFKNLLYLNGLAAILAPGLNLLGEVDPIFQYFAAKYETEISVFGPPASKP